VNISALHSVYPIPTPWDFDFLPSRSQNHLALIRSADDAEYVLCTYAGTDPGPVQYVQQIMHRIDAQSLPFRIPVAIPTISGTYVEVQHDGYRQWVATLTPLLVGDQPSPEDTSAAGRAGLALGLLSQQLARVAHPSLPCATPALGALTEIHPAITNPEMNVHVAPLSVDRVVKLMQLVEECTAFARTTAAFPQQLIHGDYTSQNVLFEHDELCAVLSFESIHVDARIYDLAIAISSWCTFDDTYDRRVLRALGRGYCSVVTLLEDERTGLLDAIRMVRMHRFLRTLGEYQAGSVTKVHVERAAATVLTYESWLKRRSEEARFDIQSWSI
jgi:Ser/Thr protein kinase RdoA (MazF antagonist)